MAGKREKPEEIVSKLRQAKVLRGQGATIAEAVCQIGVAQQTSFRWRTQDRTSNSTAPRPLAEWRLLCSA
jgi:transposase-like protein